jgi:hypothetical protein
MHTPTTANCKTPCLKLQQCASPIPLDKLCEFGIVCACMQIIPVLHVAAAAADRASTAHITLVVHLTRMACYSPAQGAARQVYKPNLIKPCAHRALRSPPGWRSIWPTNTTHSHLDDQQHRGRYSNIVDATATSWTLQPAMLDSFGEQ